MKLNDEITEMLTGMVPEMEFDDFVLGESNAIISFLAKEYGLAGKGNKDEARCAMIAGLVSDFMQKGRPVRFEQDPEKKKVLEKAFYKTDIPSFFALLVKLLEGNGGKHMVGNEVNSHCSDFFTKYFFDICESLFSFSDVIC